MRFSILALATVIGLAFASPIQADAGSALSSRSNNCFTLCKIDGGVSWFHFYCLDLRLIRSIIRVTRVAWRNARTARNSTITKRKEDNTRLTAKTAPGVHRSQPDYVLTNRAFFMNTYGARRLWLVVLFMFVGYLTGVRSFVVSSGQMMSITII